MKKIKYFYQYLLIRILDFYFRNISIEHASRVGAFLFKKIGKFSKANKTAYNNLSLAFPNLSDEKKQQILEN